MRRHTLRLLINTLSTHIPEYKLQYATPTSKLILNVILGSYRLRCRPHAGIGFIPAGLLFMKLQPESWRSLDYKADSTPTGWLILVLFAGGGWARCQLSNGIRSVSIASKLMRSLSSVGRIFIVTLVIIYLTADYSTTASLIWFCLQVVVGLDASYPMV